MTRSFRLLHSSIQYFFTIVILSAQPVIQVNSSTFDLGTIYHGEVKTIPLIVSNKGNLPLIITNVETSCGCTSARKSVPPIAPGSADTIVVSFNSLGFNGKITKSITIQSNDAAKPYVQAQLTGTVTSIMESVPWTSVINFGGSSVGAKTKMSFRFKNTTSQHFIIRGVTFVDSSINAQINVAAVAPFDSITIPFTFIPQSTALMQNYFYFETTSPLQPRIPFEYIYFGK